MKYVTPVVLLMALVGLLGACTDAGLQQLPDEEPEFVDNILDIRGQYCTSPAEDMEFPVKILVVMDQSASLQCTDQAMLRRTAVQQLVADVRGNPSVSIGYLGFHAGVFNIDFTTPDAFETQMSEYIIQLGPATDYQGVLSSVLQMLEQDMVNAPISLRARTKYVVLFVSDGVPEPRCDAGCEDDDENCADGIDNDGDGDVDGGDTDCDDQMPDALYGVCNTDEEIREGTYVDMRSICPEYNKAPQIMSRVRDMVALGESYGVGDLTFHTTFLFAPQDLVNARCGGDATIFGYVRDEAMPLLQSMADAGNGVFREVNVAVATGDSFFEFDYQPLESSFDLTETLSVNINSLPGADTRRVDSDGDGVDDEAEFEAGTSRFDVDTDNDSFSDLFELRQEVAGFDALDGNRPQGCSVNCPTYGMEDTCCEAPGRCTCLDDDVVHPEERRDRDGDGLNAREEQHLRTDERNPDTDGDRLPDGLEFRLGTDPNEPDSLLDHDFDGLMTRDEARAATNPQVPDVELEARAGVRYSIVDVGEESLTDRHCYEFEVNGIELVTTLQMFGVDDLQDPVSQGLNRIYLMMMEEPVELAGHSGNLFIGCVEATYLGTQYKSPNDGIIDLSAIREACFRSCMNCDEFEEVDECRGLCPGRFDENPGQCPMCEESCSLFYESENFNPNAHCVSVMCSYADMWRQMTVVDAEGRESTYFMCDDNCVSDGVCNCNCTNDCDCNSYRSERCTTIRACGD